MHYYIAISNVLTDLFPAQAQITIAKMGGLRFLIELTTNKAAEVKEQAIHAIKQLAQSGTMFILFDLFIH